MDIKENKGIIGVDVGVAIIIFMIFIGIITMLFYNSSMNTIATERKATATDIAVRVIENIKIMPYQEFLNKASNNTLSEGIIIPEGYEVTISVTNAQEQDILREVTISVLYKFKDNNEKVEIKTLKSYM